jgi:hypothetical protein
MVLRLFLFLVVATIAGIAAAGCQSTSALCADICQRSASCCPPGSMCADQVTDAATCTRECETLAKSSAYASALGDVDDCLEDSSCTEILGGVCAAQP